MTAQGWPLPLLQLISSFLTNRQVQVRLEDSTTPYYEVACGTPQGSPLSLVLYMLYAVLSIVILGNILLVKWHIVLSPYGDTCIILSPYGLAIYCIVIIKLGNICSVNSVNHTACK
jgi:hypothetical protein